MNEARKKLAKLQLSELSPSARAFLSAYSECGTITGASRAANISTSKHYEWLKNPSYEIAFLQAKDAFVEKLEQEAYRRAVEGDRIYKFTAKGTPIRHPETGDPYFENKRSDAILQMLLRAHKPDVYSDRQQIDVTSKGESLVSEEAIRSASDDKLVKVLAVLYSETPAIESDDIIDGHEIEEIIEDEGDSEDDES